MSKRWLLPLVAALVIYLGLGLTFGLHDLAATLSRLPWWWWLVASAAALGSHGILFQRWQFYLRRLGFGLAWPPSLRIYAAGLALIAAPGRSGEALRGLWLQRRHGYPLQVGVGVTLAERLADLASALLVLSWGFGQKVWLAMVVGFLVLALGGWLLTHPNVLLRLEHALERWHLQPRWHGLLRLLREALLTMGRVRQLMKPRPLLVGTALACLCWLLEAAVLKGIYGSLGASLSLQQTAVIRTATGLGGVLSLLPAGLGTSEATAIGLAMAYGAPRSEALAATLLLRVATVAVPCLVGLVALVSQRDLTSRSGAPSRQG
ncbi:MAG: lysylphosphatidylglycerol synthase transmembrane domain-containing protein [Vulcanococcus sp.]